MYEHENGRWSFLDEDNTNEYVGLCNSIRDGILTGFFDVVAHPDRSFRRCKEWTKDMERRSLEIIKAAKMKEVLLERNYSSMRHKKYYWQQFWSEEALENSIYGYDAHSVAEMTVI